VSAQHIQSVTVERGEGGGIVDVGARHYEPHVANNTFAVMPPDRGQLSNCCSRSSLMVTTFAEWGGVSPPDDLTVSFRLHVPIGRLLVLLGMTECGYRGPAGCAKGDPPEPTQGSWRYRFPSIVRSAIMRPGW
jgi:hypothetical protein